MQKYKYALIITLGSLLAVIFLPLMLNWLILRERQFNIVGEATDWLQFWPVYLSAIGTIAMTIATFYTLRANKKQIESITESEGAQLVFSLTKDYEYVLLKVTNVGRSVARNIQLSIPNRFEILERNAYLPFGEGLIKHFDDLPLIPLLFPNQSTCIPLYMYRVSSDSIVVQEEVRQVILFGDRYSPENIQELSEYLQTQTFAVKGSFINFLNQIHPVSQQVDNTYNVSLSEENNTISVLFKELNRNLIGIKNELHQGETMKLKDIDTALNHIKAELHSISDSQKKIESKLKR